MATNRLDDSDILALVQNTDLQATFPRIKEIANKLYIVPASVKKSNCSCNKGKKLKEKNSTVFAVTEMKNYIRQMTQADRDTLKQKINATELRFTVKDASGVLKELRY